MDYAGLGEIPFVGLGCDPGGGGVRFVMEGVSISITLLKRSREEIVEVVVVKMVNAK